MEVEGYQRLAIAIIMHALDDFGRLSIPKRVLNPLSRIRTHIAAGEFLLERNDPITHYWFTLAGISCEVFRGQLQQRRDEPTWFQLCTRLAQSRQLLLHGSEIPQAHRGGNRRKWQIV